MTELVCRSCELNFSCDSMSFVWEESFIRWFFIFLHLQWNLHIAVFTELGWQGETWFQPMTFLPFWHSYRMFCTTNGYPSIHIGVEEVLFFRCCWSSIDRCVFSKKLTLPLMSFVRFVWVLPVFDHIVYWSMGQIEYSSKMKVVNVYSCIYSEAI